MDNNSNEKPHPPKLPDGVKPREAETPRSIKWPASLYQDYYKICAKLKVSISSVTIAMARQFVKDNQHILNDDKK